MKALLTATLYRQLAVTEINMHEYISALQSHRKIVDLLVFAWTNTVTHLSQEFAFSQNLSALIIFQNRSQDSTLISVLLNACLIDMHFFFIVRDIQADYRQHLTR